MAHSHRPALRGLVAFLGPAFAAIGASAACGAPRREDNGAVRQEPPELTGR